MRAPYRSGNAGLIVPGGLILLFWIMLGASSMAQQFQYLYGGTSCRESAHSGVQPVSTGGFIAVGESFSAATAGCNSTSDIYVVRTNATGAVLWSRTFNIYGSDSALDVMECANGDFVICGTTDCPGTSCTGKKFFLLRLFANGSLAWVNHYSPASNDMDYGWDVIEAKVAPGAPTSGTSIGDLVVAGWAVKAADGPFGTYTREACLWRISPAGNMVWGRRYSRLQPSTYHDDYFYSVAEDPSGDFLAVGGSRSWNVAGNTDGYVLRAKGSNGAIANAAVFAGSADEELRSISRFVSGDYMMTGWTASTSASSEIYVLRLQGSSPALSPFIDRVYGDNGSQADFGMCVREIRNGARTGNLILTGAVGGGSSGAGSNAFLLELVPATLLVAPAPSVGFRWYGGNGPDVGWSVSPVPTPSGTTTIPEFILAGFSQSPSLLAPGDPEQMYQVKTDQFGVSGCNEGEQTYLTRSPMLARTAVGPSVATVGSRVSVPFDSVDRNWQTQLCLGGGSTSLGKNGGTLGSAAGADETVSDEVLLAGFPNPVTRGSDLQLRYQVPAAARAVVTITDLSGRTVYSAVSERPAGSATQVVTTAGWAPGTYLVRVEMGGYTSTRRIIVAD